MKKKKKQQQTIHFWFCIDAYKFNIRQIEVSVTKNEIMKHLSFSLKKNSMPVQTRIENFCCCFFFFFLHTIETGFETLLMVYCLYKEEKNRKKNKNCL